MGKVMVILRNIYQVNLRLYKEKKMSDDQQQNHNSEHTDDGVPEGQSRKFKYKRRSPFPLLLRISEHELDNIDAFFDLAKKNLRPKHNLDDWLVDDVAQLKEFS